MNAPFIKICGITTEESLSAVLNADIDYVGFIFAPASPRIVSIDDATKLIHKAKLAQKKVVTVFRNNPLKEVRKVIQLLEPDYVQLHGEETVNYCKSITTPIIKFLRLNESYAYMEEQLQKYSSVVEYFLLDRARQGEGDTLPIDQVVALARNYPIILAGGLNPSTIGGIALQSADVVKGYDVASGVETTVGQKSYDLVNQFVTQIKLQGK